MKIKSDRQKEWNETLNARSVADREGEQDPHE